MNIPTSVASWVAVALMRRSAIEKLAGVTKLATDANNARAARSIRYIVPVRLG
jgi:hypothetical protein